MRLLFFTWTDRGTSGVLRLGGILARSRGFFSFPLCFVFETQEGVFLPLPSLLLTIAHAPGGISFTFINELRRRLRPCRGGGGI